MNISALLLTGAILLASTFAASVARAQLEPTSEAVPPATSATEARPGIEEFVVLAGESEAAADYAAGDSVTGFNAADLEALGAQSIADLAAFTPNLEIVTAGSTAPTFFIRGVGLNDFNANSSGAVAIYQDDVPKNSPALQLGTLFDVEAVNVLKGPQGTGPARNASAGAIKLYSRKPTGGFGAYLRQDYGNYGSIDIEGAVEAPIHEDILSTRLSFRVSERDGYASNGCADGPPLDQRLRRPAVNANIHEGTLLILPADRDALAVGPWSVCDDPVARAGAQVDPAFPGLLQLKTTPGDPFGDLEGRSLVPEGLPKDLNNLGNWATRGMLLFRPTLDSEWLLTAHGGRRDEQSQLGQSIGAGKSGVPTDPIEFNQFGDVILTPGVLGDNDLVGYQPAEVKQRLIDLNPCLMSDGNPWSIGDPRHCEFKRIPFELSERQIGNFGAKNALAKELAATLDTRPRHVDVNRVGGTRNDVWGVNLKGEIAVGDRFSFSTVAGYDTYDRKIDIDLDMSPTVLIETVTKDKGWQYAQDLNFSGLVSDDLPIRFEVGGFYLMEELNVDVRNFVNPILLSVPADRTYTQRLWSLAGYGSFAWDFWEDFTLDGGVRYNWEHKDINMKVDKILEDAQTWHSPTGTIRLTYRFREDMHGYWKYTRGWKGGHFNATSGNRGLTTADPEKIDAFEGGLRGSWFQGRLGLDVSVFHYNYSDYQIFTVVQQLGALPEFVILNASDAEIYGSEIEAQVRPLPGSLVQVRFAWLESQFLDFVQIQPKQEGTETVLVQANNTGNPLLNSPNFKVSLTVEQTIRLGRYGSLIPRWDAAWTDDSSFEATNSQGFPNIKGEQFLPQNTIGQQAFWLHNLRLGYKTPDGSVELAGWVRNLTDKTYKTFSVDLSGFSNSTLNFLGLPRTYGISLLTTF
jgi:outer membrane receptor protein involved in Fe transport